MCNTTCSKCDEDVPLAIDVHVGNEVLQDICVDCFCFMNVDYGRVNYNNQPISF